MMENAVITIAEAVRLTGLSRTTIYRRIKAGELKAGKLHPAYKSHARVAIPRAEVDALLSQRAG